MREGAARSHVVLVADVMLEARALGVQCEAVEAADEAKVLHVGLLGGVIRAQLSKRVDDDT